MNDGTGAARENATVYSYRPSLVGAAWEFTLTGDALNWVAGARSGRIPYRDMRRLRMTYKPASMQSHRFMTEMWSVGAPKLRIVSSSWKSMVEQERQDRPYSAFIAELHRRIAAAAPPARFEQGASPFVYWPGLILFVLVSLGLAGLTVRGLQSGNFPASAIIGAFMLLFLWQGGNFFRRNRPGVYRPDALPSELLPRG